MTANTTILLHPARFGELQQHLETRRRRLAAGPFTDRAPGSLPACPRCAARPDEVSQARELHAPDRLAFAPCGHTFRKAQTVPYCMRKDCDGHTEEARTWSGRIVARVHYCD